MADVEFSKAVKKWCDKTIMQTEKALQESVRGLADEVAAHVPVVSGNLRNSRTVSPAGYPSINWVTKKFRNPAQEIQNASEEVRVGTPAYVGMRAPYAHIVERKKPYMRLAAQRWSQIVEAAAARVKGST